VSAPAFTLRPYAEGDEDAAIELWRRSWQEAYPAIDFKQRVDWWRERWRQELVPDSHIVLAEGDAGLVGYVAVEPKAHYLDQIVVAPEFWGGGIAAALLAEAKRLSPSGLELLVNKDNARAIRFYRKHGFAYLRNDVNSISGRPVDRMRWQP
jgi:putative acetyltransferase